MGNSGGEAATIEYALQLLDISNIVVCGHSNCGAITALVKEEDLSGLPAVAAWVEFLRPARRALERLPSDANFATRLQAAVEENVLVQLNNLKTHPSVKAAAAERTLQLLGAVYDIGTGSFSLHSPSQGKFQSLADFNPADLKTQI